MPFGRDSKPCRRYDYRAWEPDNIDLVRKQLYEANNFGNKLVEIEKKNRQEYRDLRREKFPELVKLEEEVERLSDERKEKRDAIKKAKADHFLATGKKKMVVDLALKKEIDDLSKTIKTDRDRLKILKKQMNDWIKDSSEVVELNEKKVVLGKEAYAKFNQTNGGPLSWGTLIDIRQNRVKGSRDPQFRRHDGQGQLSLQVQAPAGKPPFKFADLLACEDSRVRFKLTSEWKRHGAKGKQKAKGVLWIRLGTEDNKPLWVKFPMVMHRKLPLDAHIKWVHIVCRKVATKYVWSVQFVVSRESEELWAESRVISPTGKVGIDVGWRLVDGKSRRVAVAVGDDGKEHQLIFPKEKLDRWAKVDDLRSIRDKEFNSALELLKLWIKEKKETLPEELQEKFKTVPQWRSPNRLAAAVIFWRGHRFSGDENMFQEMERWRKQDKHLYEWQENQRKNNLEWRSQYYREWILYLRSQYHEIGIENLNWANLKKTMEAEQDVQKHSTKGRDIVSIGKLLEIIQETGETTKVNARNTSKTCNSCKKLCSLTGDQFHTCEHCGATWDRETNACQNILDRMGVIPIPVPKVA